MEIVILFEKRRARLWKLRLTPIDFHGFEFQVWHAAVPIDVSIWHILFPMKSSRVPFFDANDWTGWC